MNKIADVSLPSTFRLTSGIWSVRWKRSPIFPPKHNFKSHATVQVSSPSHLVPTISRPKEWFSVIKMTYFLIRRAAPKLLLSCEKKPQKKKWVGRLDLCHILQPYRNGSGACGAARVLAVPNEEKTSSFMCCGLRHHRCGIAKALRQLNSISLPPVVVTESHHQQGVRHWGASRMFNVEKVIPKKNEALACLWPFWSVCFAHIGLQ